MSADTRHQRAAELFDEARDLPPSEREAFLARIGTEDAALADDLRELLAFHHEQRDDSALRRPMLDHPIDVKAVLSSGEAPDAADLAAEIADVHIPGFRILRSLGEGGMGTVYLAAQDKPRRQVAIKVMRRGATSPGLLKRFDLEQEMLGRLQHPGIAQIYETGVWRPGGHGAAQPFFVMEYVQGKPLNEFVDRHHLGTRQRLRLLLRICDAVQHAHAKGIVHRDLKPGNILVAASDQDARNEAGSAAVSPERTTANESFMTPKILDFGVARATNSDIQVTTLHTGVGQLIGTLAYMSPEQAAGDPALIDARSDVYALGVIGYELLAGRLPHSIVGRGLAEAARIIRDEDPTPLSTVNRVFRGDLDTIFTKTLEREPARRYQSAAELGADLQRYLDDQPIIARPPSTIYNLQKFTRRNQGLVAGIAVAFTVLVAGVIGTTLGMLEAQQQRDEAKKSQIAADREADTARAVTLFLQETLGSPDPLARGNAVSEDPKQTRIIDMLDGAAARVGQRFADRPLVEADVRGVLGRTYSHLGEFDKAEPQLRRALDLYERELGEEDHRSLDSLSGLGTLYMMQHRFEEADALKRREIALNRRLLGPTAKPTLDTIEQLALMRSQLLDYDGSIELLTELYETRRSMLGDDDPETMNTLYNISWAYAKSDRYDQALPLALEVRDRSVRVLGEADERSLSRRSNVAWLYERMQRVPEAETMYAGIVDTARASLPATDWHLGTYLHNHASALRRLARYAAAEPLQLEAIAIFEKNFDANHNRMRAALEGAVTLYEAWDKPDEAAKWRAKIAAEPSSRPPASQPASPPHQ